MVAEDTIYVSCGHNVYSYTLSQNTWIKLKSHMCSKFGMMVIISTLTSIGGCIEDKPTNILYSLIGNSWEKVFPPMPTERMYPAVVNITTHLIVAGGRQESQESALATVEILNMNDSQWFTASSLPVEISHPEITECNGNIYCSEGNSLLFCSQDELLMSRYTHSDDISAWKTLAKIPVPNDCSLTTLKENILAVGGAEDPFGDEPIEAIHSYDLATDSWSVIDQIPIARSSALTACLLPRNELVVIGGYLSFGNPCNLFNIRRS